MTQLHGRGQRSHLLCMCQPPFKRPPSESIYTALLAHILFSWLAYNFIYIYLYLKYFLFFAERLETANRQLASRDFDGHEDKSTEGLYVTQSEFCVQGAYIYMHTHIYVLEWRRTLCY